MPAQSAQHFSPYQHTKGQAVNSKGEF